MYVVNSRQILSSRFVLRYNTCTIFCAPVWSIIEWNAWNTNLSYSTWSIVHMDSVFSPLSILILVNYTVNA